jgi:Fe-S-cluster containining protein
MDELKQWVVAASMRDEVRQGVRQIYADLQQRIDQRRPVCLVSGRCCRFDEYGHRLYVTTAELAAFVAELPQTSSLRQKPRASVQAATARLLPLAARGTVPQPRQGGCIFQDGKLCRVHAIRPMGCRIFFCDATATDWQREVYEHFHARLKELHRDLSIPYAYVEWRLACQKIGLDDPADGRER